MIALSDEILAEHYAHVADKPFFPEIVGFMQSSPVIAMVLEGEGAIDKIRDMLGPTNSKEAPAGTIRGDLGDDMMVNVCHASDSPENGEIEVARFFEPSEIFTRSSVPIFWISSQPKSRNAQPDKRCETGALRARRVLRSIHVLCRAVHSGASQDLNVVRETLVNGERKTRSHRAARSELLFQ